MPLCFHVVAALNASRMPVSVSPRRMLATSTAMTGVWSGLGWSGMVFSCSVVCPWKMGRIASGSLVSSVVMWLWRIAAVSWMFFIVRRLSSVNCWGRMVSSSVMGGKLYLVVVCVYCGC